ncbi:MAG: glycosyltransferase family 4 protein, partial [Chloroflexi bacterium]|nr:glycosyltransferase family 4 protein [Chloroflexota bacterium]
MARSSDRGHNTRVLFVSPLPPPAGGIASWTKAIMERGLPGPFEVDLVDTRVTRQHLSATARPGPGELKRTFKILRAFRQKIRTGRYDVIHINSSLSNSGIFRDWLIARAARRAGVPFIVQLRGEFNIPGGRMFGALRRRVYRSIFKNAAAVLPLTKNSQASAIQLGADPSRVQIVPNFIVVSDVPVRSRRADPDRLRVVYLGNLSEAKGALAIMDIARKTTGIEFRLFGSGSSSFEHQLKTRISEDGLQAIVHLEGAQPVERARAALAENDVYLMPSATEGFPIS